MKAAVLTQYRRIEWLDVKEPEIADSEVLVKVNYASVCGTDQHVFKGEFHPRTHLPLIMGHEFGGTIVAVGRDVSKFKVGDRVVVDPIYWCGQCAACRLGHYPACSSLKLLGIDSDGGFGQYVGAGEFMLHALSDDISDRQAALIEVLSIGFHASHRAGLQAGQTVAIFGAGKIGQCILQAARTFTGNTIFVVDILSGRLELARKLVDRVIPLNSLEHDPVDSIRELTEGRGVDTAFEAVGHAQAIAGQSHPVCQCVDAIRGGGTVCVLGLGDDPVPLVMKRLIWKEARLVASRVTHGEFSETIAHMRQGHLRPDGLVSCELPASQAQDAFELLAQHPQDYLKILLKLP